MRADPTPFLSDEFRVAHEERLAAIAKERDEARVAKMEAISRAGSGASPEWWDILCRAVSQVAIRQKEFTMDDVWERIERVPDGSKGQALGALMTMMAKEDLVQPTSRFRESKRRICHGRPMRIWKSWIYR